MPSFSYTASGGLVFGGAAVSTVLYKVKKAFSWDIRGVMRIAKDFAWNTGDPPLYWYRIEGKCIQPNCDLGQVSPPGSCSVYLFTEVLARNVSDVCDQLRKRGQIWSLKSIYKHSLPAEPTEIAKQVAKGVDESCDTLIPVPFCDYPACLDFCVDYTTVSDGRLVADGWVVNRYSYSASGGIKFSGSSPTTTGGTAGGSSPPPILTGFYYTGTGGITFSGSAGLQSISLGTRVASGACAATLVSVEVNFGGETPAPALAGPISAIPTSCKCNFLTPVIQISHNLDSAGKLANFIMQNGFELKENIIANYSRVTDSWRSNVHFSGIGSNGAGETWSLLFEWQCTSIIGSFDLENKLWRFGLLVSKNNVVTGKDDTRVLLGFADNGVCESTPFRFRFKLNTTTQSTQGVTSSVIVNTQLLYDEIGLFESPTWLANPTLDITLGEPATVFAQPMIDLTGSI